MNLPPSETEFLEHMSRQLDESITLLAKREVQLIEAMGDERATALREYWEHQLDGYDERDFAKTCDCRDRELLAVWTRQRRISDARTAAGQTLMKGKF